MYPLSSLEFTTYFQVGLELTEIHLPLPPQAPKPLITMKT
ncbi:rCG33969 [Rattus norvegicus]|uniref:RCG33969 n=1 Tax=Rattus norvegicus TaxID=10116 RepID=A6HK80_RAT|nr:rCG33969 [Rattus norvegicus]